MCIKKEDLLKMPIQNGMVMKKKPKIVIASKPASSGKKRLISQITFCTIYSFFGPL